MIHGLARLSALFVCVSLFGCAARARVIPPPTSGCLDGAFKGRYFPASAEHADEKPRRFELRARVCEAGRLVVELRGIVGGPALVVAVEGPRALMILPRERRAITGPADATTFWTREIGLPLSGALLRRMASGSGGETHVSGWSLRPVSGATEGRLPSGWRAVHVSGDRFELRKTAERPALGPAAWPTIPEGFETTVAKGHGSDRSFSPAP
ncbi:MAG: hypothetical protein JSV80_04550 [Acidobacteriota bacterium]|nr:MAG: hypothetical protein JSV80_04550 [Acidobacteriota bacterium]